MRKSDLVNGSKKSRNEEFSVGDTCLVRIDGEMYPCRITKTGVDAYHPRTGSRPGAEIEILSGPYADGPLIISSWDDISKDTSESRKKSEGTVFIHFDDITSGNSQLAQLVANTLSEYKTGYDVSSILLKLHSTPFLLFDIGYIPKYISEGKYYNTLSVRPMFSSASKISREIGNYGGRNVGGVFGGVFPNYDEKYNFVYYSDPTIRYVDMKNIPDYFKEVEKWLLDIKSRVIDPANQAAPYNRKAMINVLPTRFTYNAGKQKSISFDADDKLLSELDKEINYFPSLGFESRKKKSENSTIRIGDRVEWVNRRWTVIDIKDDEYKLEDNRGHVAWATYNAITGGPIEIGDRVEWLSSGWAGRWTVIDITPNEYKLMDSIGHEEWVEHDLVTKISESKAKNLNKTENFVIKNLQYEALDVLKDQFETSMTTEVVNGCLNAKFGNKAAFESAKRILNEAMA